MVTAILASLAATTAFAQAFSGTWNCHFHEYTTRWQIAAAPGSSWTTVRWGDQSSARGGIAYVGYVEPKKHWIYEDFHYDGSYAIDESGGPKNNAWTWIGTYYAGAQTMHGAVVWRLASPARIDRTFERPAGSGFKPTGTDYCTKN